MLVDRAPQVMGDAVDLHEHLVEVPLVAQARAPPAQLVSAGLPELGTPAPDRLITHHDTTYRHQLLNLTKAQREPKVQPHAMVDDLHRIPVTLVRRRCGAHPTDPPRSPTQINVTVPRDERASARGGRRRGVRTPLPARARVRTDSRVARRDPGTRFLALRRCP